MTTSVVQEAQVMQNADPSRPSPLTEAVIKMLAAATVKDLIAVREAAETVVRDRVSCPPWCTVSKKDHETHLQRAGEDWHQASVGKVRPLHANLDTDTQVYLSQQYADGFQIIDRRVTVELATGDDNLHFTPEQAEILANSLLSAAQQIREALR